MPNSAVTSNVFYSNLI